MTEGPEKAKKACIDHANVKKQTALMVACKHGHPECVEYLVSNGADPLISDERRHNTCLHLGALYGHSECIHKLLGARSSHTVQGRQLTVAQMPFYDEATATSVKFVDSHNGWGLTALHIAVFQGAVNTARALLRHGASLETVITAPRVESSPIRCAVGSNALHIAALVGNVAMARVVLEAQESVPGLELRAALDSAGLRPQEYAQRARNLVMVHLLDERLPVHLLRQVWLNYSLDGGMPARHQTLASMLQKLKLMFNLEVIAAQRNIGVADAMLALGTAAQHGNSLRLGTSFSTAGTAGVTAPDSANTAAANGKAGRASEPGTCVLTHANSGPLPVVTLDAVGDGAGKGPVKSESASTTPRETIPAAPVTAPETAAPITAAQQHVLNMKAAWTLRLREIQALLVMVSLLCDGLQRLVGPGAAALAQGTPANEAAAARATAHEAILDFILSMLITPRTVSAVLHSAKKLVTATVQATGTGPGATANSSTRGELQPPSTSSEAQHSMGLLLTALKAVETCLQAAAHLSEGAANGVAGAETSGAGEGAAAPAGSPLAAAAAEQGRTWTAVDTATNTFSDELVTAGAAEPAMQDLLVGTLATDMLSTSAAVMLQPAAAGAQGPAESALESGRTLDASSQGVGAMQPAAADVSAAPASADPAPAARVATPRPARGAGTQQPFLLDQSIAGLPPAPASAAAQALAGDQSIPADLRHDPVHMLRMEMVAMMPGSNAAAAAAAAGGGAALPTSHWSSHLHTLLAQLQWDIGIQRHRRRRQHAAAAAARASGPNAAATTTATTAAAENLPPAPTPNTAASDDGETGFVVHRRETDLSFPHRPPSYTSDATALTATYDILAHRQQLLAAAHQDMEAGLAGLGGVDGLPPAAPRPLSALYRVLSRRGDAPQDVLVAPGPAEQATDATTRLEAETLVPLQGSGQWGTAVHGSPQTDAGEWGSRRTLHSQPISPVGAEGANGGDSTAGGRVRRSDSTATGGQRLLRVAGHPSPQQAVDSQGAGVLRPEVETLSVASTVARLPGPSLPPLPAPNTRVNSLASSHSKVKGKDTAAAASECQGDDLGDSDSGCGSISSGSDAGVCAICMDLPVAVMVTPCSHGVCVQCALQLTIKGRELPSCPFCRRKISGFEHKIVLPVMAPSRAPQKQVETKQALATRPLLPLDSLVP